MEKLFAVVADEGREHLVEDSRKILQSRGSTTLAFSDALECFDGATAEWRVGGGGRLAGYRLGGGLEDH